MLYQLCPRCQFKLPAGKHVCLTCGLNVPVSKLNPQLAEETTPAAKATHDAASTGVGGFWRSLLGLDHNDSDKKESKADPALGET